MSLFQTVVLSSLLLSASPAAAASAQPAPDPGKQVYEGLSKRVGPALVTVKMVLKIEGGGEMFGGGDEGREMEITGLMIDPSGLVLCSNVKMGGIYALMGGRMGGGGGVSATPTDIKVFIGESTDQSDGLKAKMLARDTELDLAWVQIDPPGPQESREAFKFVDLAAQAPEVQAGDRMFVVQRMGKFFDRALVVSEGRVGGATSKPRRLVVPSGVQADLGMPVFDDAQRLIGIGVLQIPSAEDMEGGDGGGDPFGGGMGGGGAMILPAAEVEKATKRTREMIKPE